MAKSAEARKVLRDLDRELELAGRQQTRALSWTAQETAILGQISSILDRKSDLLVAYEEAENVNVRVKLSAEVRLLEQAAARLVMQVQPSVPEPRGLRSVKASKAANQRWARGS